MGLRLLTEDLQQLRVKSRAVLSDQERRGLALG